MKTYRIEGSMGQSTIVVGDSLSNLGNYLPAGKVIVITEDTVWRHHRRTFPAAEVIKIPPGETAKSLETIEKIYVQLVEREVDRSTFIVGIGGGVICDIAGFVASTFMRGLRFGFVASTLLAQVDASVGGKNGVNFGSYKNLIGTFNQPEFVICDPALLKTLSKKEILCGVAEIVKHALVKDADLFAFIEANVEKIFRLDSDVIERLVSDSIHIKASVVNQDEREGGLRRILNFGHTFGHALEKIFQISHGEAVGAGMVIATEISNLRGLLEQSEADRIKDLLQKLQFSIQVDTDRALMLDAIRRDKKREADVVHFVLLRGIGQAVVEKISLDDLEAYIK
jgi:3-dehydroquinate synthase